MDTPPSISAPLTAHPVWDAGVRWFHWINLLCVLGLIAVGVAILNDKALGVDNDGKILLKTVHVWIGYAFALNLTWRLVWAFFGGPYSRWSAFLPGGRGYLSELRASAADLRAGRARQYLGHDPFARIAISVLLLLLSAQAITGLVLAGTDLFLPPFGGWIAAWVAAPGIDPGTLVPYQPGLYDADAYAAMRKLRAPVVTVHLYVFYSLLVFAAAHIAGVVITELRDGGSMVSAMFTGKKILRGPPVDQERKPLNRQTPDRQSPGQ